MKTKKQIINKWKSVNWIDIDSYNEYIKNNISKLIFGLSDNFISEFDPEKIGYKNFWKASEIIFGTDSVANNNTGSKKFRK